MANALRHRVVPPRTPGAEQVCTLDKETALAREEAPDAFLAEARSQETRPDGTDFHFEAKPGIWERVSTFIEEEAECCAFFAFEQWEESDEVVLRITRPPEKSE